MGIELAGLGTNGDRSLRREIIKKKRKGREGDSDDSLLHLHETPGTAHVEHAPAASPQAAAAGFGVVGLLDQLLRLVDHYNKAGEKDVSASQPASLSAPGGGEGV